MERVKLRDLITTPSVQVPTMLNMRDIAELTRVDPSTVSRWARNGRFPKPVITASTKLRLWLAQDYADWVKANMAKRDEANQKRRRHA